MISALEQLKQGGGGSALDLLRRGFGKPDKVTFPEPKEPSFFEPSPEKIRIRDVIRELPKETLKTAKSIGQSIARSFLATGQTITSLIENKDDKSIIENIKSSLKSEFKPETKLEKSLAGTDQPVSFENIGKETLSILGKDFSEKHSKLALPVGLLMAGLDIVPFGGSGDDALKAIIKVNKADDAIKILTKMGVTDNVARQFADEAVKAIDEKAAKQLLENVGNAMKKITPEIPPTIPIEDTFKKLIKSIDEAVPLRAEQKKLYQEEMAKRTARVAAMGEKVGGEKGFFAQLGQLKGELPKKQFEAIRGQFSQNEIDLLFDTIEQTKTLLPLEKVSTKEGLRKLFEGAVPTKGEIEFMREVFPKEMIDSVLARQPFLEKAKKVFEEFINIPRTMMATLDLSAPFRQGVFMIGRPKQFIPAFKDMFKFTASEKAYQGLMEGIKARPSYLQMKQGRLALTEIGGQLAKREERFIGNLAEKIPLYGGLVRASNRAYTGFLNKLRADVFDDVLKKAKISGVEINESLLKSLGDFVNAGTGRGKFGFLETGIIPKSMENAAVTLNGIFFSPRLMASRLNLLNPYFYVNLDPFVRKEAMKTLFGTTGILGSIYGLWKLNGGNVGIDPKSADFGKLKIGNTRYDILGGFQQYVKLAAQLISGEIVSSTTGRTITLGEGYKPLTRKDIILRFFESKESPIASFITGLLTGQTAIGGDIDVPTEVINRFIPMVVQDLYDLSQEKGSESILMGLPAIFGTGVQTYGKQELVSGESKLGEPTMQIRPILGLAEKIRERVLGQISLGTSKSFNVETYFDELNNLPREEAAEIFDKIVESNPDLAKQIKDVVEDRELGITVKDKDLKSKGVTSGDRALAIKKQIDILKTKEEKAALWEDYVKKGIITKKVSEQLLKLLK